MSTPSASRSTLVGGSDDNSDDFVMLDASQDLAIRSSKPENEHALRLELNTLPSEGSMAALAPLPDTKDEKEQEAAGLTVLDLVRHASRTILSTLNQNDRLAIVTFSNEAEVVQPLTIMTATAKAETSTKIEQLTDHGMTNLWGGIKTGLQLFEKSPPNGKIQGLFVLTDGRPNYMCPPQGYIPKLEPLLDNLRSINGSTPTIQTFGFGYDIRSDLMLSIAKTGNGNFAFMPEVGMIGTVFVHAIANLYSTFATNAVLTIDATQFGSKTLSHESGLPVEVVQSKRSSQFSIKLGNMIYGQSRDVIIHYKSDISKAKGSLQAQLTYSNDNKVDETVKAELSLNKPSTLSQQTIAYHLMRNELCNLLSSLYPVGATGEHCTAAESAVSNKMTEIQNLVQRLVSIPNCTSDPNLSSLLADIVGPELNPKTPELGQVHQALQVKNKYWQRWGRHYLSSLWCAHMRQMCNSFKDPGPLRYGTDSALFKKCRDELDSAFDNLPPPKGTWRGHGGSRNWAQQRPGGVGGQLNGAQTPQATGSSTSKIRMSRWNRSNNPCFLGSCPVKLATGESVTVDELRPGMVVETALARDGKRGRKVILITRTSTKSGDEVCRVGSDGLWVTPWHPIFNQRSQQWVFPSDIANETRKLYNNEPVFSIMLESSDIVDHHTITIGSVPCVTLGHGLTSNTRESNDIRAHPFFGDRALIRANLANFPTDSKGRILVSHTLEDARTSLASCFCPIAVSTIGRDYVDCGDELDKCVFWDQEGEKSLTAAAATAATQMTQTEQMTKGREVVVF